MKNFFLFLTLINLIFISNTVAADRARGVFVAFGVGPRLPVFDLAGSTDLGYGFNLEFSYTDSEFLPIFLFAKVGYEQYPGSQSFYQETEYANLSTNVLPVNIGARYYFKPLLENVVLLMPIVEVSAAYSFYNKLHQFKPSSNRNNYTEESSKFGASAGIGFSMFLMEMMATYNYLPSNQFIAFDLRVRIPLFINY
ncbi:MAG: hypothetical protein IPM56_04790 [Ignavibacteriales bacterium]|nr:MAG: hypothetical protein IPM56_04790 [Ignavibacteriales bacterium]